MTNPQKCLRLFSDEHGETHLDDIEIPLEAVQFAPPAPALLLSQPMPATRFSWLRFPESWEDDAHPSPCRQLFVVMTGEVEIWTSLGDKRTISSGDCLLMEDTQGKGHGAKPVRGEPAGIMIALD